MNTAVQDELDARRYRWLCENRRGWFSRWAPIFDPCKPKNSIKQNLDRVIDELMAGKKL